MNRFVLYRWILWFTSIPLAILMYFAFMSGYGLIKTKMVKQVTMGLLNYHTSMIIHTSQLFRLTLFILLILHFISGFSLMSLRLRNRILRKLAEILVWFIAVAVTFQVIVIEFYLKT